MSLVELEVAERQHFERTWGSPLDPPLGWDSAMAEDELERLLLAWNPDGTNAVSCEFYPCVAVMHAKADLRADEFEDHFGIKGEQVAGWSVETSETGAVAA